MEVSSLSNCFFPNPLIARRSMLLDHVLYPITQHEKALCCPGSAQNVCHAGKLTNTLIRTDAVKATTWLVKFLDCEEMFSSYSTTLLLVISS